MIRKEHDMTEFRVHHPGCDLCGEQDFKIIASRDRLGGPLRTVICRHCGLVRHWRLPTDDELLQFYGTEYRRSYHGEYLPSDRRVMRAWKKAGKIFDTLAPYLTDIHRVFEVGAGVGCTVKYFQRQGFDASGVEPNEGFQHYAVKALRARVEQGAVLEYAPFPNELVLLVHVIEHLRSPREVLKHLQQFLTPSGLLYIECPDLGASFSRRSRMFHYAHIHNFTRTTLRDMVESCGYDVTSWLAPGDEPNLCLLATPSDVGAKEHAGARREIMPHGNGFEESLSAVQRYNFLSYHLRSQYLTARAKKFASYAWERCRAKRFVSELLEDCQRDPPVELLCPASRGM
jgi:SAM-dependent methyltransferase